MEMGEKLWKFEVVSRFRFLYELFFSLAKKNIVENHND
jgi:hypothetical protein